MSAGSVIRNVYMVTDSQREALKARKAFQAKIKERAVRDKGIDLKRKDPRWLITPVKTRSLPSPSPRKIPPKDPPASTHPRLRSKEEKVAYTFQYVAQHFGLAVHVMRNRANRTWDVVRPRQAALYLCVTVWGLSNHEAAQLCDTDHTTVGNALKRINEYLPIDRLFGQKVTAIEQHLQSLKTPAV